MKRIQEKLTNDILDSFQLRHKVTLDITGLEDEFLKYTNWGQFTRSKFRFKEVPNWIFAIDIHYIKAEKPYTKRSKENILIYIYAQNELFMNKFNFSGSILRQQYELPLTPVKRKDGVVKWFDKKDIVNVQYPEIYIFNIIFDEPYIAFWIDHKGLLEYEYVTKRKAKKYYNKNIKELKKAKKYNMKLYKKYIRVVDDIMERYKHTYIIDDGNEEGYYSYPRYNVVITTNRKISDDELSHLDTLLKMELDNINNNIKKSHYLSYDEMANWFAIKGE